MLAHFTDGEVSIKDISYVTQGHVVNICGGPRLCALNPSFFPLQILPPRLPLGLDADKVRIPR